ncbi:MAG TPA: IS110 family transposase [Kofleriaceae bacterium]|nr:IS110 family transposase [Kofleriaceae bacterium]
MPFFVGLDWASREHAVCVVDERGRVSSQFTVSHGASGLGDLVMRLKKLSARGELRIAIERPSGLLVDTLVDAGFAVVPINPAAIKACRTRYSVAKAKSDPGDAYVLADVLRTDGHRFRTLTPLSDQTKTLRALTRLRDDLVAQRVALANQLRSLLEEYWPGPTKLFTDLDCFTSLAFIAQYPTPQSAEGITEKQMRLFLHAHSYTGRRTAAELVERLRAAPRPVAGERECEAKGQCARALVAVLQSMIAQIASLTAACEQALATHEDAEVVTPLFREGRLCAALLLSELGDDRGRFVSADHLAAEGGVAPVTRASGKHRAVAFRFACNKRLRGALTTLADTTRHTMPWARAIYERARERGCKYAHAIRILARAWCRVLWHVWQQRVAYDPNKHRAARELAQASPNLGAAA